jgi:hypothetical protein
MFDKSSETSIPKYFQINYLDPAFNIINYYKTVGFNNSDRSRVEDDIKSCIDGMLDDENTNPVLLKFCEEFKKGDYSVCLYLR